MDNEEKPLSRVEIIKMKAFRKALEDHKKRKSNKTSELEKCNSEKKELEQEQIQVNTISDSNEKENSELSNSLKLFVIFIGMLLWFPLAYYSYVFANWLTHYSIDSHSIFKFIILILIYIIWITGVHKVVYAMFFVTMNHKYGDLLYCISGISATFTAYFLYLKKHPIIFDSNNSLALLTITNESIVSKSLTISIYLILMIIFVSNYCFFPLFNRKG